MESHRNVHIRQSLFTPPIYTPILENATAFDTIPDDPSGFECMQEDPRIC